MRELTPLWPGAKAFTFHYPAALLEALQADFRAHILPFFQAPEQAELLNGGKYHSFDLPSGAYSLCSYDTDPLFWVANAQAQTYSLFQTFFEALGLEEALKSHLPHRQKLVMYCGFFVVGNQAPDPNWHYDYRPGAPAYTLITPLFELSPEHGHLLYELPDRQRQHYRYQTNEAIVLGDGFLHSTEPYEPSPHLRVLLSLTCGTDLPEYWPLIKENIAEQSHFYCQPCGHIVGTCRCLEPGPWQKLKAFFQA